MTATSQGRAVPGLAQPARDGVTPRSMSRSIHGFGVTVAAATLVAGPAIPAVAVDPIAPALAQVESGWAQANFATTAPADKLAALDRLVAATNTLQQQAPGRAEPLIWNGVLLATKAGVVRGLTGFRLVHTARQQLERAEAIEPMAENGLGLMQLGILYYRVPGPPIGFGDRRKARAYLERARAFDPQGLPANLALAGFLVEGGRFADAEPLLEMALRAPMQTDQPIADRGRRVEAAALLKLVRQRLGKPPR